MYGFVNQIHEEVWSFFPTRLPYEITITTSLMAIAHVSIDARISIFPPFLSNMLSIITLKIENQSIKQLPFMPYMVNGDFFHYY